MEFKQLDIEPEGNWFQRTFSTPHAKKSIVYILIGMVAGLVFLIVTSDKPFVEITSGDFFQSILFGGFLGFFITNSPCARNKC